jgi:hypothetical protein
MGPSVRTAALAVALLAGLGCAHPAPAPAANTPSVAGTQWAFPPHSSEVPGAPTQLVVTFLADGTATFSGLTTGGHWTQNGAELVFDSNGFTEYRVVISSNQMTGTWKRLQGPDVGKDHETSLARVPPGS